MAAHDRPRYELLDLALSQAGEFDSIQAVLDALNARPRRKVFILRYWRPPSGRGEAYELEWQWKIWADLEGRVRHRAFRRHWPVDPDPLA